MPRDGDHKQMPGSGGEHRDPGGLFRGWRTEEGMSGCPVGGQSMPVSGSLTLVCVARSVGSAARVRLNGTAISVVRTTSSGCHAGRTRPS